MKKYVLFMMVVAFAVAFTGCSSKKTIIINKNGKIPPGQMKKATGSKSAAPYAPGQQKKSSSGNGNSKSKKKD